MQEKSGSTSIWGKKVAYEVYYVLMVGLHIGKDTNCGDTLECLVGKK